MQNTALTVRQLNLFVKSLIEGDVRLNDITVIGEISNFKNHYASGHLYFTLKDNDASIRCVMFKGYAQYVKFAVKDGLKVVLRGKVSIYEKDGQYQFYAQEMHEYGKGDIALQFEQIKEKLSSEGLFDTESKRPIPKFPKRIAVITSDTGAAVQDIINILSRRWPLCEIMLYPVAVQGENAVPDMLSALDKVYESALCDTIIIGRGGGSIEDLWAFNSELLARKIYESPIPVISAVGHETDFTICDFVSDLRAPTPSAAAELAVPDINEINLKINSLSTSLKSSLISKYNLNKVKLEKLTNSYVFKSPIDSLISSRQQITDNLTDRLLLNFQNILNHNKSRLSNNISKLDALSPLKILSRGFSVIESEGKVITSAKAVEIGDNIILTLSDGKLNCTVNSKGE
jgi:exodeoxyribonuclease VII large subunit